MGRPLIVRHGSRVGVTDARLTRVEAILERYGPLIVAGARFVILLRQINGIAAGTIGMNWLSFFAANMVGAALWVGLWTTLAYHFGKSASLSPALWAHLSWGGLIVVVSILAALVAGTIYFRTRPR